MISERNMQRARDDVRRIIDSMRYAELLSDIGIDKKFNAVKGKVFPIVRIQKHSCGKNGFILKNSIHGEFFAFRTECAVLDKEASDLIDLRKKAARYHKKISLDD